MKRNCCSKRLAYSKDATEVCQFLGLASYYRRYVLKFAEIACPLNNLIQKGMPFLWSSVTGMHSCLSKKS